MPFLVASALNELTAFIAAAAHQREILGTYNQGTLSDVNDTLPYPS